MWGPPSAMVEDPSPRSQQGIVPRIFQKLFAEIQRKQENSDGKQINYQCRCSFLEIYNEQIGDLLDPTQRNLEIKDDSQKWLGLSSRKVGATSINSKSSRSHIVFTFILESWCKVSLNIADSLKLHQNSVVLKLAESASLILLEQIETNLMKWVDKVQKEGKYVRKTLSQLGYLVNALVQETQPGKPEDAYPWDYRETVLEISGVIFLRFCLLLKQKYRNIGEILSTIRFGQRIKCIRNDPVINEISEDDVNDLSDQIRQLKEELIRAKSDVSKSVRSKNGHFRGKNVRDSLNQLRVSLNRSLMLPRLDNDFEEEVNYDEEDVKVLREQLDKLHKSDEEEKESSRDQSDNRDSVHFSSADESCEADLMSEDEMNYPQGN
ncbi:hypothetical protein Pint_03981 [Pistacia integerrima]|uniref:Uncharacterized protein n=1 Tax=Pistacia integerrima TaxID=434235 RepID=A0ACC0Z5Z7_9ROSI|nr:hypothetical protein Pint_03981 [Pistacia integerrima]